jgi:hypothetical protein
VGYLQFENGALYATDSPEFSKRFGINQVTKLSINERMEVLALFEPFTHSSGAAVSGNRPGEVRHTLAEVQGWFAENAVEYLRAYPSAMLCEDSEELFAPAEDNWYLEGWLAQLGWIGALGHEGGLFVIVGRRN